jgi:hypothetical protein
LSPSEIHACSAQQKWNEVSQNYMAFGGCHSWEHANIDRIEWPHSAAAFYKDYSLIVLPVCTDVNGLFLTTDGGDTVTN